MIFIKNYRTRHNLSQFCWKKKSVFCGSNLVKCGGSLLKRAQNAQNRLEHGLAAEHFTAVIELALIFRPLGRAGQRLFGIGITRSCIV